MSSKIMSHTRIEKPNKNKLGLFSYSEEDNNKEYKEGPIIAIENVIRLSDNPNNPTLQPFTKGSHTPVPPIMNINSIRYQQKLMHQGSFNRSYNS